MELQDFAPAQLFSRLVYRTPAATILDRKGETMQAMHDALELSNFTLPPTSVEVSDEAEHNKYRIGISQIFANLTDFEDLEDAEARTREFFEMAVGHLRPSEIDGIHVVSCDIAPAESFEALRDRLNNVLYADLSGLRDAFGYSISDSAWVQEFEQDDASGRVQFGPMRSEELPQRLEVLEVADAPPNMLGILADFRFKTGGVDQADAVVGWEKTLKKQRSMVDRVGKWIKGLLE